MSRVLLSRFQKIPPQVFFFIGAIFCITLVALLFYSARDTFPGTADPLPFALYEDDAYHFYALAGNSVHVLPPHSGDGSTQLTPVFFGPRLSSGERAAIISIGQGAPTVFGVVSNDGIIRTVINNGLSKSALTANSYGAVVFSEDSGTAKPWRVISLSVSDPLVPELEDIGRGYSAAFTKEGELVAVTPAGLMHVDFFESSHDSLVGRVGTLPSRAAVSPDGTYAALYNPITEAFDFFSILSGREASYIASFAIHGEDIQNAAIAFVSPDTGIIRTSLSHFIRFTVTKNAVLDDGIVLLTRAES